MANPNRSAFVLVRADGSYFGGFVEGGYGRFLGKASFSVKLCDAEMYSTIGVAERFKYMIDEELKVRRVDLHLGDV